MKIDLQAVYVSVKSAYYARLNRLIDEVTALRNGECDGEDMNISRYMKAETIQNLARDFVTIAETFSTLEKGRTREDIVITNEIEYRR